MRFCLQTIPFLLLLFDAGNSQPYLLNLANRPMGSNTLTLQCKDYATNPIHGALFYRNGAQNISDLKCFKNSSSTSSNELRFTITPECDGHYSCGLLNSTFSVVILSQPISIYAYPLVNGFERYVNSEEGDNVTIPCDFIRSPINTCTTKWIQGLGSMSKVYRTFTDLPIQDLVIADLDIYKSHHYYCIVIPDRPYASPSYIGPTITLLVNPKYEFPVISNDLYYTKDNDVYTFSISANGTQLTYEWLLNGTSLTEVIQQNINSLTVQIKRCGFLKISYKVSNVDYEGTTHTAQQSLVIPATERLPNVISDLSYASDMDLYTFTIGLSDDTLLTYQWFLNDTLVRSNNTLVRSMNQRLLKLHSQPNMCGPLNVTYKTFCAYLPCYSLTQSITVSISCSNSKKDLFLDFTTGISISAVMGGTIVASVTLNLALICIICYTCCKNRKTKPQTSDNERVPTRPKLQSQLSTLSGLQIVMFKQTNSERMDSSELSKSTSSSSTTSSSSKHKNPMADILEGIAQMISNSECGDIEQLQCLNQMLTSVIRSQQSTCGQQQLEAASNVMTHIQRMKDNVPQAVCITSEEVVTKDGGGSQRVATDDNVKASVCYHDQDMFERPLAVEEQKELIDILDDMSTNLEQLLSCYSI